MDDSSDESLHFGETEPDNLFNVNILDADDFVLVIFVIRKGNVFFYVERVAEIGDDDIEVMFLKKWDKVHFSSCF